MLQSECDAKIQGQIVRPEDAFTIKMYLGYVSKNYSNHLADLIDAGHLIVDEVHQYIKTFGDSHVIITLDLGKDVLERSREAGKLNVDETRSELLQQVLSERPTYSIEHLPTQLPWKFRSALMHLQPTNLNTTTQNPIILE